MAGYIVGGTMYGSPYLAHRAHARPWNYGMTKEEMEAYIRRLPKDNSYDRTARKLGVTEKDLKAPNFAQAPGVYRKGRGSGSTNALLGGRTEVKGVTSEAGRLKGESYKLPNSRTGEWKQGRFEKQYAPTADLEWNSEADNMATKRKIGELEARTNVARNISQGDMDRVHSALTSRRVGYQLENPQKRPPLTVAQTQPAPPNDKVAYLEDWRTLNDSGSLAGGNARAKARAEAEAEAEAREKSYQGKDFFGRLLQDPGRALSEAWNSGIEWLKGAGSAITDLGRRGWEALQSGGKAVGDAILGREITGSNGEKQRMGGLLGQGGAAEQAGKWLNNAANDVGNWVGQNVVDPAGRWLGQAGSDVNKFFNGNTYNRADQYGNVTQQHDPGLWENIGNAVGGAVDSVGRTIGGAANDVGNWVGQNVVDPASRWLGQAGSDVNKFFNGNTYNRADQYGNVTQQHDPGLWENIGNAVGGAVDSVGRFVGDTAGQIDRGLNNLGARMATSGNVSSENIMNIIRQNGGTSSQSMRVTDPDTGAPAELVVMNNGQAMLLYPNQNVSGSGLGQNAYTGYRMINQNDLRDMGM